MLCLDTSIEDNVVARGRYPHSQIDILACGPLITLLIISAEGQEEVPLHRPAAAPERLNLAATALVNVVMEKVLIL
jgi:hypothetical protein